MGRWRVNLQVKAAERDLSHGQNALVYRPSLDELFQKASRNFLCWASRMDHRGTTLIILTSTRREIAIMVAESLKTLRNPTPIL
jgi:hypothetical protein